MRGHLNKVQYRIFKNFYDSEPLQVAFAKDDRKIIWDEFKQNRILSTETMSRIESCCPSMSAQITRAIATGDNIQSAVFSECVYAQAYACILNLDVFTNCYRDGTGILPSKCSKLLNANNLVPRYIYSSSKQNYFLIQAGGCRGVDCALYLSKGNKIITIEFKEPWAKTSEPDLPKYGENGLLRITKEFLASYPQFEAMLDEQKDLNFFEHAGHNVNNFSPRSINIAVSNNYSGEYKKADFLVTEDNRGFLIMIPVSDLSSWARTEGEIRPAGRNPYGVWTPQNLNRILVECNAIINDEIVSLNVQQNLEENKIEFAAERGGDGTPSRLKIQHLFFVPMDKCSINNNVASFSYNDVRQLNPTITAKLDFRKLFYEQIKSHYFPKNIS